MKILGVTTLSLLLFFVAGIVIMRENGRRVAKERLETETHLAARLVDEEGDYEKFVAYYENDELRVTLLSLEGEVLYESDVRAEMENHLAREEVQAALNGSPRTVERYSETLDCRMTYYAVKTTLKDGTEIVVRLGLRNSEISGYILAALPLFALSLGVAVVVAAGLASKLSKGVSDKITCIGDSLKSVNEGNYRPLKIDETEPEFLAVYQEINEINASTSQHIAAEKEVIRQKSEFFANASHELKTPITVMRGLTEILLTKEDLNEQERKQITRIHKESLRMADLISDMLKLSKLERSEEEERVEVDIRETAEEIIAELSARLEEKNLTATVIGEGRVIADPKRIFELVQNLCSNAVNYNKQGGWIKITIEETEANVCLRVSDGGIGIEREHIPRLCERFYRVDKSRSKKTGGTGLGLAIVKHICALYGAELTIESVIGEGTEVSVVFKK